MPDPAFVVRSMTEADLPQVGPLAQKLVDLHYAFDQRRFMHLPKAAQGYQRYFASQIADEDTVLLVAAIGDKVVGYTYARIEERDYNALLDKAGWLHDVCVDETSRARGVGEALVRETVKRLEAKGAPRVLLSTATQNENAQRLFKKLGFRTTMLEMTRDPE